MKKVLKYLSSGIFIMGILFFMTLFYSIKAMNISKETLRILFNDTFFIFLYLLLLFSLTMRIFRKRLALFEGLILIFLLLISISIKAFNTQHIVLREGDRNEEMEIISIKGIPESIIITGNERPERFSNIEIEIRSGNLIKKLKPFPFTMINRGLIGLDDIGISPVVEIRSGGSVYLEDKLTLLPPPKRLSISPEKGINLSIGLEPARVLKKGRLDIKEYDLKSPVYRVILKKGERVLLERSFRDGDEAMVEGITLKVRNTAIWIKCKRLTI